MSPGALAPSACAKVLGEAISLGPVRGPSPCPEPGKEEASAEKDSLGIPVPAGPDHRHHICKYLEAAP